MRGYAVKKNHISPAVSEIIWYTQILLLLCKLYHSKIDHVITVIIILSVNFLNVSFTNFLNFKSTRF